MESIFDSLVHSLFCVFRAEFIGVLLVLACVIAVRYTAYRMSKD